MIREGSHGAAPLAISRWQLTAMTIVVCTGFSSQMVEPIWLGQVIEALHLSTARAGAVASAEFFVVAITSVIMATFVGRAPCRAVCVIGTALLLAGNLASMFLHEVVELTVARVVCGVGKGLVIAVIFGLAGQTERPVRSFAILNAAYAAFSALVFLAVPPVAARYGMAGAFGAMVCLSLIGMVFLVGIPQANRDAEGEGWLRSLPLTPLGLSALAGLTLMWTAHGSVWAFIERIGVRNGLALATIGGVLSVGAMLSVFGPLSSHLLDVRRGTAAPIVAGLLVLAATASVLCLSSASAPYYVVAPIFSLAGLFVLPYVMGLLGYIDPTGKLNASSSAFMTLGGSLGPLLGGVVIEKAGYGALAGCTVALFVVVIAMILPLALEHDRRRSPLASPLLPEGSG